MRLIRFWKPFGTLSQFTDPSARSTLADFGFPEGVYAAGRLDLDSEGLLLLTDHGPTQARIADPRWKAVKKYWAQVEGDPTDDALEPLRSGIRLKDGPAAPAAARLIDAPTLPDRDPPIRYRAKIPTRWIELELTEGRNRQVRRMTAAIGFPTLRLVRWAIGPVTLDGLAPGKWSDLAPELAAQAISNARS